MGSSIEFWFGVQRKNMIAKNRKYRCVAFLSGIKFGIVNYPAYLLPHIVQ